MAEVMANCQWRGGDLLESGDGCDMIAGSEVHRTLTIEIDPDIDRRLNELVARTGETKADLLRNALANGIEDVEDYFSAAAIIKRLDAGEEKTYPLAEVLRELDLED